MSEGTTYKNIDLSPHEQTISAHALLSPVTSADIQISQVSNSSCTSTLFVVKFGETTGTTSRDNFIKKYIANSDLVSNHFLESLMNFIKTVDNKDS